jgi:hypothetical protein
VFKEFFGNNAVGICFRLGCASSGHGNLSFPVGDVSPESLESSNEFT